MYRVCRTECLFMAVGTTFFESLFAISSVLLSESHSPLFAVNKNTVGSSSFIVSEACQPKDLHHHRRRNKIRCLQQQSERSSAIFETNLPFRRSPSISTATAISIHSVILEHPFAKGCSSSVTTHIATTSSQRAGDHHRLASFTTSSSGTVSVLHHLRKTKKTNQRHHRHLIRHSKRPTKTVSFQAKKQTCQRLLPSPMTPFLLECSLQRLRVLLPPRALLPESTAAASPRQAARFWAWVLRLSTY